MDQGQPESHPRDLDRKELVSVCTCTAYEACYEELVALDELLVILSAIPWPSDGRLAAGTPTAVAGLKRT